jgi:hypothetical protein
VARNNILRIGAPAADFALKILEVFGEERFNLADYFSGIERGGYQRMPDPAQNQRMREQLDLYTASVGVLLSAPGPRGGVGWRLNPAALPALRKRQSVLNANAARRQQEYDAIAARRREILNKPRELREALADNLRRAGLAEPALEELMSAVDAIVAADRRARSENR